MKRPSFRALLLTCTLLLAACSGIRKLGPVQPVAFDRHGWSGADLTLRVGNASSRDLRLLAAQIVFYYDETPVGTATLMREAVAERHSFAPVATRWRLRVDDPGAAHLLQKRIETHEYDRISVGYALTVRFGSAKRTFSAEMVPLSNFLVTFDPTIDVEP